MRRLLTWTSVALVATLLTACFVARAIYRLPLDRSCYEFTVAFWAEGSDYVLALPVATETYRGPPWAYGGVSFRHTPKRIGKRLPSGAAVVFGVPFKEMSALLQDPNDGDGRPDVLPSVIWLDDTVTPSVMEAYVSELYYTRPSPRVRVNAISAQRLHECKPSSPNREIPWLASDLADRFMHGLVADVVPEVEWRKIPTLSEKVMRSTRFEPIAVDQNETWAFVRLLSGRVPAWNDVGDLVSVANREFLGRGLRTRPESEFVRPISRDSGELVLHFDDPGKVIYYPGPRLAHRFELRIGDRREEVTPNKWYFDPTTRTLISVYAVTF